MTTPGKREILAGTARGLYAFGRHEPGHRTVLAAREITALARDGARWWALVDGHSLWRTREDGEWEDVTPVAGRTAACLAATRRGLLVGTEGAHLLRLEGGVLAPVESFERAEGRAAWYTPWGDPPDVRSIAVGPDGAIYVNVHVGGVLRSTDDGAAWRPTLDIEHDVHQVLAHPARRRTVLVAAAVGLGVSGDGGDTWTVRTEGLHARYLRAVAVAGDTVVVSASTGPGGRRAAIYRARLEGGALERCRDGLPEWFDSNIDTGCLAASGSAVAFGTGDGRLYVSGDAGLRWQETATGLPPVHCVALE